jgi:hypothetical protein
MDQILYQFSKLLTDEELLLYIVSTVFHYSLYSMGIRGCSEWTLQTELSVVICDQHIPVTLTYVTFVYD